jgi:rod shape-determining protein MreD
VKGVQVVLAILLAFVIQTLWGRYLSARHAYFDLFLLTTALAGLSGGRVVGMGAGTAAGLVQDAFSGGMLGLNGLSKTVVGYLAGLAGNRLILRGFPARFVFFVLASATDLGVLFVLGLAVGRPLVWGQGLLPLYIALGNGLIGAVIVGAGERFRLTSRA